MIKRNILITGGTGFLGRELIKQLSLDKKNNIVCIGNSENRIKQCDRKFKNVHFYCMDLSHNKNKLNAIVKRHKIDYIIHAAAMKHVGLCEKNSYRAVEVNVLGSKNVLDVFNENSVKNAIAISTDKAINPSCVYGTTKYLMEKMFLENDCGVFNGVNFLFSDGSVLDIWDNQRKNKEKLSINVDNSIRYFVKIQDAATLILNSLNTSGEVFYPKECYKIKLHDLAAAYCNFHDYHKTEEYYQYSVEKLEEDISNQIKIVETTVAGIECIFKEHYGEPKNGD